MRGFLLSSAHFWLDRYHADGLRLDAVASMLYRDYSRAEGEWVPNVQGGRENQFLQDLNQSVYRRFPCCSTFAEESTAWPMVSGPVDVGGTWWWRAGTEATLALAIELAGVGGEVLVFGTLTSGGRGLPYYQLYFKELALYNPRAALLDDYALGMELAVGTGTDDLEGVGEGPHHRLPLQHPA